LKSQPVIVVTASRSLRVVHLENAGRIIKFQIVEKATLERLAVITGSLRSGAGLDTPEP